MCALIVLWHNTELLMMITTSRLGALCLSDSDQERGSVCPLVNYTIGECVKLLNDIFYDYDLLVR